MIGVQNHLGEERKLLGSSLGLQVENVNGDRSEKCDESINLESCFQFEEDFDDESSRLKNNHLKSSSETQKEDENQQTKFNKFLQKVKSLLTFNRKFVNFKQIYQQLFFDGAVAVYFLKMRKRCQKYVETSFKDEQCMREISNELKKDSFHYYNCANPGNKCIVWGKLNQWEDFQNQIKTGSPKKSIPYYTLSSFNQNKEIKMQTSDCSSVFCEQSSLKTFTKRGVLYRLITSLYALNLFKINIQPENISVKFGFVYVFGEKVVNSVGDFYIKPIRIFQSINYQNYRRDQTVFSAFGVIVGGLGFYFLIKFFKNAFMCSRKKRLLERIKEFFVKPKEENNQNKNKQVKYQKI
ncbi:hypothetical protein ABPG74_001299 [Tetrahymena malaccensis]